MGKGSSLLNTHIELKREFDDNQACFYKLIIGTDSDSQVVITDSDLARLLSDLPNFLSTVIHSKMLIENTPNQEKSK